LLALADRMDEQKRAILKAYDPELVAANEALKQGKAEAAAVLYDRVSGAFDAAALPLEAKYWAERAKDCRKRARSRAKLKGRKGG
jgi:hypothetical protein